MGVLFGLNVFVVFVFVAAPVIVWVVVPGFVVLVRSAARELYDVAEVPGWNSVDELAARLRTRARWWGIAHAARNLVLVFGAGYAGFEISAELRDGRGVALVTSVVVVGAWLAGMALHQVCRRLADPLFVGPMYDVWRGRYTPIRVAGQVVRMLGGVILVPAVVVAGGMVLIIPVSAFVVAPVLAVVTAVVLRLDRIGLRMLVRSRKQRLDADLRPALVYLRDFADDRVRMSTSRVSRRGLAGRLSPSTRRTFEEVIAWRFNRYGPLVAVTDRNDPLTRLGLARLGAAREALGDHEWQDAVKSWSASGLAVIVSAAPPGDISPGGLGWDCGCWPTGCRTSGSCSCCRRYARRHCWQHGNGSAHRWRRGRSTAGSRS